MVTKYTSKPIHDEGPLPPISEAWWESILTDEEVETHSFASRYPPAPVEEKIVPEKVDEETQPVDWDFVTELFELDKAITLEVTVLTVVVYWWVAKISRALCPFRT
jgi:hypothetical protein